MDDILKNKEKYENMPCFELNFGNSKYCFDKSKAYIEQKYISSTTKEDESVSLYFAAEALLPLKRENKFVNIYWNIDKYSKNNQTYPEYLSKNSIKKELKNKVHFDKDELNEFLSSLKYPLYFLDYETFSLAIPALQKTRP